MTSERLAEIREHAADANHQMNPSTRQALEELLAEVDLLASGLRDAQAIIVSLMPGDAGREPVGPCIYCGSIPCDELCAAITAANLLRPRRIPSQGADLQRYLEQASEEVMHWPAERKSHY